MKIAIDKGFKEYNFKKIEAGTSLDNIGSQRVLEKNHFVLVKKIEKNVQLNDEWIDSLIYEIVNNSKVIRVDDGQAVVVDSKDYLII